ncbi:hypothetical protein ASF49_18740 [Methylobacterium sp. Leaf104]|nr:hypothetical protein ASF49_18740 [Methylobacterium sp. Leaf104]
MRAADDRLERPCGLIESVTILHGRFPGLKLDRSRARVALDHMSGVSRPPLVIDPDLIEPFGRPMPEPVMAGAIQLRTAWLPTIVDRIETGDAVLRGVADAACPTRGVREPSRIAACGSRF